MTLDQKKNRAYVVAAIGAVMFGLWQSSGWAAVFIFCVLLLLGGLVVAVQDGFKQLTAACDDIPPVARDEEDKP